MKKKAFLVEQVSAILHNNNALKYKDPGCPTISCFIGEHKIERVYLGASMNLLPYLVFQHPLGMSNRVILQLKQKVQQVKSKL